MLKKKNNKKSISLIRAVISCTIFVISIATLLSVHIHIFIYSKVHVFSDPTSYKLPSICDMVAVARVMNTTLVVPEPYKRSFWQDTSNFSDVFYLNHFVSALSNEVKIIKNLPKEPARYRERLSILEAGRVGAPARVGLVAPIDVVVPPGNTGLDQSQTSIFRVLNIPTKINKGTVEIITHVELIKKGEKVGSSEAALLAKLGIGPFSYGLVVLTVYDNSSVFIPEVLDLTNEDLMGKFAAGVSMVTSLSLAIAYATLANAPHIFINAYKNLLVVALATKYSFPQAEQVKEYLKFAAVAPSTASGSAADLRILRSFVAVLFMVPFSFPIGLKLWER
ncbi:hypothetical protein MKW92_004940 [Papaver armeniacum]|nr:hypothetical protein MKW92_004940 [Papaver armeniacum]